MIASAASWVVRYRILNMYSRLPPEPQRKEPEIDLFPDTHDEGMKARFTNYLDEFLSAIKIFGYLERPVFHELTRSMQTRKLIAGETINLEEEKGFCIVVDGLVQIFVKSGRNTRGHNVDDSALETSDDEEELARGHQKYHLLTEVRNGAPMSSMFSIMSLFTEDVKLVEEDKHGRPSKDDRHGQDMMTPRTPPHIPSSMPNSPQLDGNIQHPLMNSQERARLPSFNGLAAAARIPPMSLDGSAVPTPQRPLLPRRMSASAHPDIIARATVDTTIAIIPASAFRRLIKIYPKATAHIVHVILSRFQRVTLSHAFNYLGLTTEVLQAEKNILKFTSCQLPNMLRGDALARLKEKFKLERDRHDEDQSKGIALHNAAPTRRRRSSTGLRKEAAFQALSKQRPSSMAFDNDHIMKGGVSADVLASVQHARNNSRRSPALSPLQARNGPLLSPLEQRSFNPFDSNRRTRASIDNRDTGDEGNLFRESILECMFKVLGLDSGGTSSRESIEASPRLVSMDQRRSKAVFSNNAFGLMGPIDGPFDGETESVTSSGFAHVPMNAQALAQEMKNDVEIVFFPKGSVLVEQGERSPGLYYVVDGFLEIGTANDEVSQDLWQRNKPDGLPSRKSFGPELFANNISQANHDRDDAQRRESPGRKTLALVKPGGLAGYVGSVSSYRSFIDVVAKTDVYVGFLPRPSLERIVDRYPIVLLTMAKRLTNILPRLLMHIDFALEWVQVNAGQVIFHDKDDSDAIYIVLNGRLRLIADKKDGGVVARAEFGQGESVGELEVLTETAYNGTLHAIRDTELVKFPRTLFNSLAQEHPKITIKVSKIIASQMRAVVDNPMNYIGRELGPDGLSSQGKSTFNLRTVAILPVTAGVPVVEFGNRLMNALAQVGPTNGATSLNQAGILNHLGKHAFNKIGKLRLSQYLADLEEKYGLVIYVAGTSPFYESLSQNTLSNMMRNPTTKGIAVDGFVNSNFFLIMLSLPHFYLSCMDAALQY